MATYRAFLHRVSIRIEANSLYEAKQIAEEHFRPRKKDRGLLAVILESVDDKPIIHNGAEL